MGSSFTPARGTQGVLLLDPTDFDRVSREGRDGLTVALIICSGIAVVGCAVTIAVGIITLL